VKFILAVFQEKEAMTSRLESLWQERREIAEVGPFSSKGHALRWMEYMEEKLKPAQVERHAAGCLYPCVWYGVAFQADGVVDGKELLGNGQGKERRADNLERRVIFPG